MPPTTGMSSLLAVTVRSARPVLRNLLFMILSAAISVVVTLSIISSRGGSGDRASHMQLQTPLSLRAPAYPETLQSEGVETEVSPLECPRCPACKRCATCARCDACPSMAPPLRPMSNAAEGTGNILAVTPIPPREVIFITYGDSAFARSRKRILREASSFGVFNRTIGYTPADLDPDFAKRNADLLARPRGGGYWAWKSYILYRTLLAARDGDIVFYNDAGSTFRKDPSPLIALAAQYGGLTFNIDMPMEQWVKGAVFAHLDMPMEVWGKQRVIHAATILLQRRPHTLELAKQFMLLSQNISLISDDPVPSVPNHQAFIEHRHDQSIWSLLCYKYGAPLVLKGGSITSNGTIVKHTRVSG
jgi:hypothetical protein